MRERPDPSEYPGFNPRYVALVPDGEIVATLAAQPDELRALLRELTPERALFRYEPGKWTVRDLVGHVSDSERVFGYRALCIARSEAQPLPGFDESAYAAAAGAVGRPLDDLVTGFVLAREANLHVLRGLTPEAWHRVGTANAHPVTVRALAYVMAGHVVHHISILRERYGVR